MVFSMNVFKNKKTGKIKKNVKKRKNVPSIINVKKLFFTSMILTVHEVTHTVYSYFILMLDITASVILTLT